MAEPAKCPTCGQVIAAPPEDRRIWKYRKDEARLFSDPESVPAGQGWVDSPALVDVPEEIPQIESVAAEEDSEGAEVAEENPAAGGRPRGRPRKVA
jgi:hypothetical protein